MSSLAEVQAEVGVWHRKQFGDEMPAFVCLLKAMSELGELADLEVARLEPVVNGKRAKMAKQSRRFEFADVMVTLLAYAERAGIDAEAATGRRWAEVKKRDYRGAR